VDLCLTVICWCQVKRPDWSTGDGVDQVLVSSGEEVHTVRCAHRFQCFDPGNGVGRGGAAGDAARVQDVAADSKFTYEFLEIVTNINRIREQFCAVSRAFDVGAVVRPRATASEQIAWQWWYDDATGVFVSGEKSSCVLKDFSEHGQRTHNNVASQMVFSGRVEWH
jgi:hypothetical protein